MSYTSIDTQISLLETLIKKLQLSANMLKDNMVNYGKYVKKIDKDLLKDYVDQLENEYYFNTNARVEAIIKNIYTKDIPTLKKMIEKLNNAKIK